MEDTTSSRQQHTASIVFIKQNIIQTSSCSHDKTQQIISCSQCLLSLYIYIDHFHTCRVREAPRVPQLQTSYAAGEWTPDTPPCPLLKCRYSRKAQTKLVYTKNDKKKKKKEKKRLAASHPQAGSIAPGREPAQPMPTYLNQLGLQSSLCSQFSPSVNLPALQPRHLGELGQLKKGMCW